MSNFMYSSASLYSALQAAAYGADGNTREEIINLIGEKEYDLNSEVENYERGMIYRTEYIAIQILMSW